MSYTPQFDADANELATAEKKLFELAFELAHIADQIQTGSYTPAFVRAQEASNKADERPCSSRRHSI